MSRPTPPHRHSIGIHRREMLQIGYSGLLGIGMSSWAAAQERAATAGETRTVRKPRSVIIVFLTGAPSHLETFDPKPDAPAEIRGEFKPIATKVPAAGRRASALPGGAGGQVRGGAVAVASGEQSPGGDASRADGEFATGRVFRQGGVARRLAELCLRAELPEAARRRSARRSQSPHLPHGRSADLAGAACRIPRAQVRPLADHARPERGRFPRGKPSPGRGAGGFANERSPRVAGAGGTAATHARRPRLHAAADRSARPRLPRADLGQGFRAFEMEQEPQAVRDVMAGVPSVNRCCWRGGWCRRACRSCSATWAGCRTGTRTATTSVG